MRSRITAAARPSSRCLAAAASPWPLVLLRWRLLLRCGLEKVKAVDGTVEWVAPESKERFVKEGAACLIWNQQELS